MKMTVSSYVIQLKHLRYCPFIVQFVHSDMTPYVRENSTICCMFTKCFHFFSSFRSSMPTDTNENSIASTSMTTVVHSNN